MADHLRKVISCYVDFRCSLQICLTIKVSEFCVDTLLLVHIAQCIKHVHNSFRRYHRNVKFDVLLAVVLKTHIFWDVTTLLLSK